MVDVSVVVPTLNEEAYIRTCLDSIQTATQQVPWDAEVLVLDSDSDDATELIIEDHDLDVEFHSIDMGLLYARHKGMEKADGDIVVSCDADTLYASDWLLKLVRPFFYDDTIVMTYGGARGRLKMSIDALPRITLQHTLPLLNRHWASGSNRAIDKETYFDAGGYNLDRDSESIVPVIMEEQHHFVERMSDHGRIVFADEAIGWQTPRSLRQLLYGSKGGGRDWTL